MLHVEYDSQMLDVETPMPEYPDQMLPIFTQQIITSENKRQTPNLDILLSKFLNNDELNDIEIQQLNQQERLALFSVQQKSKKAKKRSDEYQKLFFRRAFKFAEKEYFGKRNKNKSRKMSSFYHYHFDQISQSLSIPLVNFYNPDRRTKPGLKIGQKSFNKSYIRLLLRSDSFRQISKAYQKKFKNECLRERTQKIPKFSSYIKNIISRCSFNYEQISQLIKSSKCKVPWTNQQIQEASKRALSDLQSDGVGENAKQEESDVFRDEKQLQQESFESSD